MDIKQPQQNKLDFITIITMPIRFTAAIIVVILVSPMFVLVTCFYPKTVRKDLPRIYKDILSFIKKGREEED